ncbi:alpha/beta fold hydrolase [Actinophytocola sp. NPDC049390]|uniref:alpha/beta fold hydrolase n=1 Tax=Actinophytocola sp. NPDC049390 TaxID=3363894 RepID=UPI0037AE7DE0
MNRNGKVTASIALCCVALAGCDEAPEETSAPPANSTTTAKNEAPFTGKVEADGGSVQVSCAGEAQEGRPVVVLLHGGGDDLTKMADLQNKLSDKDLVCSYDRLGAGASDKPGGPQTIADSGDVLTAVIDRVAGDAPVVLAGHSLGGLLAARYAPDHQDRVAGLVLLDATSPTQSADLKAIVPANATGPAADLVAQTEAVLRGQNPERLVTPDGDVASAGDIPVQVVQHGKPYLAEAVPEYGQDMEQAWAQGQRKWLAVSSDSTLVTAPNSGHYVHVDEPEVAVRAIQQVVAQAAEHNG